MFSITVLGVDVTPAARTSSRYHSTTSARVALAARKNATPATVVQRCRILIGVFPFSRSMKFP